MPNFGDRLTPGVQIHLEVVLNFWMILYQISLPKYLYWIHRSGESVDRKDQIWRLKNQPEAFFRTKKCIGKMPSTKTPSLSFQELLGP